MKIFELYFNPKTKEDKIFESFCFNPENIYEKKLGNLYMVGELSNALPQNINFLNNIASVIKKEYYSNSQKTPEQALKSALKKVNEFLEELSRKKNVNWLGNLKFAVLDIKNFLLNFTKTGEIKILLLRKGEILDISENLEFQDMEPYPLKVFGNIALGKLRLEDRILVFTKDIFNLFIKENLIEELSQINNENELNQFFKNKKSIILDTSGICLLIKIDLENNGLNDKQLVNIDFQEKISYLKKIKNDLVPTFSFLTKASTILHLGLKALISFFNKFKIIIPKNIKINRTKKTLDPIEEIKNKFSEKKIKKKSISFSFAKQLLKSISNIPNYFKKSVLKNPSFKKNIILISSLILILIIGTFVFQKERVKEAKRAELVLIEVQELKNQAENALIFKKEILANKLYIEAWQKIFPETISGAILRKKAESLKNEIENKLAPLNNLEIIEKPEIVLDFKKQEIRFIPRKIAILDSDIYFSNPFSSNIYIFSSETKSGEILEINEKPKLITSFLNSVLFFSEPNILTSYSKNKEIKKTLLKTSNFSFNGLTTYKSNIYFLENKSGEIIKYGSVDFKKNGSLNKTLWLNSNTKKSPNSNISGDLITVDGSIWILIDNGKVNRYHEGRWQETIKFSVFPYIQNPTKLWTFPSLPYLYVLEPLTNRLIITNKNGEIIKQYQSKLFNNILDFAVSKDGKTIYILNNSILYKIGF